MSPEVLPSQQRVSPFRDSGAVSPELVLVDPSLAASAREQLPDATDSLARAIRVAARPRAPRPVTPVALATAGHEARDVHASSASALRSLRSSVLRSRSWAIVAGVAAAVLVGLLLPEVRVARVERDPAAAETAAIGKPPAKPKPSKSAQRSQQGATKPRPANSAQPGAKRGATKPPARSSSGRQRAGQAPQPRRFAWAPAADATGYHVELFRGASRVFSADTSEPQLTIPAQWKQGGQQRSLVPGEYRWYVWPVVSGKRASQAIVQARLVVPASPSSRSPVP